MRFHHLGSGYERRTDVGGYCRYLRLSQMFNHDGRECVRMAGLPRQVRPTQSSRLHKKLKNYVCTSARRRRRPAPARRGYSSHRLYRGQGRVRVGERAPSVLHLLRRRLRIDSRFIPHGFSVCGTCFIVSSARIAFIDALHE